MAKLSRKKSIGISFLLAQMTLADDQSQREEILRDLLESLGIDAKQAQESRESAGRYLRYKARQKRNAAKPEYNFDNPRPIDDMGHEELQAYLAHLMTKMGRLIRGEESTAQPAPRVEEAPTYDLPTAKMRKAVAAFDDLRDSEQVDVLRQMWG